MDKYNECTTLSYELRREGSLLIFKIFLNSFGLFKLPAFNIPTACERLSGFKDMHPVLSF